jgi:hypothetical protein
MLLRFLQLAAEQSACIKRSRFTRTVAGGGLDCVQIYAANGSTINNLHQPHSSQDNQHEIWICQVACQVMFFDLDSVQFVFWPAQPCVLFDLQHGELSCTIASAFESKPNPPQSVTFLEPRRADPHNHEYAARIRASYPPSHK